MNNYFGAKFFPEFLFQLVPTLNGPLKFFNNVLERGGVGSASLRSTDGDEDGCGVALKQLAQLGGAEPAQYAPVGFGYGFEVVGEQLGVQEVLCGLAPTVGQSFPLPFCNIGR